MSKCKDCSKASQVPAGLKGTEPRLVNDCDQLLNHCQFSSNLARGHHLSWETTHTQRRKKAWIFNKTLRGQTSSILLLLFMMPLCLTSMS